MELNIGDRFASPIGSYELLYNGAYVGPDGKRVLYFGVEFTDRKGEKITRPMLAIEIEYMINEGVWTRDRN